ncbi:MAG: EpsI family protein [Verrucomicrobia bacterium]|nr:EpsI family protein [Verrucomicrobiota bacterium]
MNMKPHIPQLAVILLIGAASLVLALTAHVDAPADSGIPSALPRAVAGWTGEDVFFCQNEACGRAYGQTELAGTNICRGCNTPLRETWSVGEVHLLPPGTILLRKTYSNKKGNAFTVTIVGSGAEQTSIHRPQACLPGQGYQIVKDRSVDIAVGTRDNLSLRVLESLARRIGPNGAPAEEYAFFAYWFTSGDRRTSSNIQRMLLAAKDRVIDGRASRWAYVSITGPRDNSSDKYETDLRNFVQALYPLISTRPEKAPHD